MCDLPIYFSYVYTRNFFLLEVGFSLFFFLVKSGESVGFYPAGLPALSRGGWPTAPGNLSPYKERGCWLGPEGPLQLYLRGGCRRPLRTRLRGAVGSRELFDHRPHSLSPLCFLFALLSYGFFVQPVRSNNLYGGLRIFSIYRCHI